MLSQTKTWETLYGVDVNDKKEKKGNFDYLSWTDAIQKVKDQGSVLNWEPLDDVHFPDGSMEVRMRVTIDGNHHVMWLAVSDHRNQAIVKPDAAAINKARMRCLVKGIAVHGLGLYIYQGEDLPLVEPQEMYDDMQARIANDQVAAILWYMRQPQEAQSDIYNSAPPGVKVKFKDQLKALERSLHAMIDESANCIEQGVAESDDAKWQEAWDELTEQEQKLVWARINVDVKRVLDEYRKQPKEQAA